jgi:hypothetical protein
MRRYVQEKLCAGRESFLLLIILSIVVTILLLPLLFNTYVPKVMDVFNHLAGIIQANKAFMEGQFILRTAPSGHYSGFRYPFFEFYSPTSYTIAGLIYHWITPSNPFNAFKLAIWCANLFAGIYMYKLAFAFVKSHRAAILAAVVYLFAPYNIIVINHLGNLTEAMALGVLPSVIFYTLQCYEHPENDTALLKMSLVWYLLATIHLITFLCTTFFVFIFFILAVHKISKWKSLLRVGIGYLFSSMLLMWYLGPIVLYSKFLFVSDLVRENYYPSSLNTLFSPIPLISKGNIVGMSKDLLSEIHPSIGLPILVAVSLCLYLWLSGRVDKKYFYPRISSLLILFFIIFFIIWSPINFWRWLPSSFGIIQYTWRLLGQLTGVGAILFAWAVCWVYENRLNKIPVLLGIGLIMASSIAWLKTPEHDGIEFKKIAEHPYIILNGDAYLFNVDKSGTNEIDLLSLHFHSGFLKMNDVFYLPRSLFQSAYSPMIQVEGSVSTQIKKQQLQAIVDNKIIGQKMLKSGAFYWEIKAPFLNMPSRNKLIPFQFKTIDKTASPFIKINNIQLSGFLNPKTTFFLKQLPANACQQKMNETICNVNIPKGIQLLELPVFYYPDMLNITLNGKSVAYHSILQGSYLLVGIVPLPGANNTIHIQFRGLLWANFISYGAWSLFLIFSIFLLLRKITNKSLPQIDSIDR